MEGCDVGFISENPVFRISAEINGVNEVGSMGIQESESRIESDRNINAMLGESGQIRLPFPDSDLFLTPLIRLPIFESLLRN